jgi:hypothetical protein
MYQKLPSMASEVRIQETSLQSFDLPPADAATAAGLAAAAAAVVVLLVVVLLLLLLLSPSPSAAAAVAGLPAKGVDHCRSISSGI